MTNEGIPITAYIFEGEYASPVTLSLGSQGVTYCPPRSTPSEHFMSCIQITYWSPKNTWWNRLKYYLGLGKKPEKITRTFKQLTEPLLAFDKLPKEPFPKGD